MKFKVFTCQPKFVESNLNKWVGEIGEVEILAMSQTLEPLPRQKDPIPVDSQMVITTICYTEKTGAPAGETGYGATPNNAYKPLPEVDGCPECPNCGKDMVARRRSRDGNPFWGCSGFPHCRGIVDYEDGMGMLKKKSPVDARDTDNDYNGSPFDEDDDIPF